MSLQDVINKKAPVIIGINSGTSADGVDLAVLQFSSSTKKQKISLLAGHSVKYPSRLKTLILKAAAADSISLEELIYLDNILGMFYGRAAAGFIKRFEKQGVKIAAVASHGQTIRHSPRQVKYENYTIRGTLQLGSLEYIATLTGKITVGDFRQADIALGREGAPITTAAMARLFADPVEPRLLVNIGGISNFFYFPARGKTLRSIKAADCGPGNSLIDLLAFRLFGEKYDRNGCRAQKGNISQRLMALLLTHPFFKAGRQSTGREEFGFQTADRIIDFGHKLNLDGHDLLATATEFTVISIVQKIKPLLKAEPKIKKLYLTGGGEKNTFLKARLRQHLPECKISSVRQLGFNPAMVEAAAYAVMGLSCLRGERLRTDFMRRKASKRQPVLGKIVQPPGKLQDG